MYLSYVCRLFLCQVRLHTCVEWRRRPTTILFVFIHISIICLCRFRAVLQAENGFGNVYFDDCIGRLAPKQLPPNPRSSVPTFSLAFCLRLFSPAFFYFVACVGVALAAFVVFPRKLTGFSDRWSESPCGWHCLGRSAPFCITSWYNNIVRKHFTVMPLSHALTHLLFLYFSFSHTTPEQAKINLCFCDNGNNCYRIVL